MTSTFDTVIPRRGTRSVKWRRYPEDVLPMWVADMDFRAPQPILDALAAEIEHGVLGYDFPSRELQAAVAARMETLYGWQVAPEAVVTIPGLVTGFNVAAKISVQPGEGLLVQPPVYFPFLRVHQNLGLVRQDAEIVPQNLDAHTLRYEIDFEAFDRALHSQGARTRMFLFCNPHNPTGRAYTRAELTALAERCLREDLIICSDEIHSELLLGETEHIPIAALSPEVEARTITLVAASKTFNVPGLFTGFAIIPEPDLRRRFVHEVERLTLHTPTLGHAAAQVAFSGAADDWLAELRAYLTANRDFLLDFVRSELPGVRVTAPEATYLAWLDFRDLIAAGRLPEKPARYLLEKGKVALNEGADFGPGGAGFARLNFGTPRVQLEEGLERIRQALREA